VARILLKPENERQWALPLKLPILLDKINTVLLTLLNAGQKVNVFPYGEDRGDRKIPVYNPSKIIYKKKIDNRRCF
jgi:hypothetical protein